MTSGRYVALPRKCFPWNKRHLYGALIACFVIPPEITRAESAASRSHALHRVRRVVLGDDLGSQIYPFIVRIVITFSDTAALKEPSGDNCPDVQGVNLWELPKNPKSPGQMCVGTVISSKHVLTAGRCLWPVRTNPVYTVYYGASKWEQQKSMAVVRLSRHPNCKLFGRDKRAVNDLAVFEVAQPFPEDVAPVVLPEKSLGNMSHKLVDTAGWGNTNEEALTIMNHSKVLQQATLRVLSSTGCKERYPEANLKGQICATTRQGQPHLDDFGAPLLTSGEDWYQLGVFSWFDIKDFPVSPFVFTSTLYHKKWIRSVADIPREND